MAAERDAIAVVGGVDEALQGVHEVMRHLSVEDVALGGAGGGRGGLEEVLREEREKSEMQRVMLKEMRERIKKLEGKKEAGGGHGGGGGRRQDWVGFEDNVGEEEGVDVVSVDSPTRGVHGGQDGAVEAECEALAKKVRVQRVHA